MTSMLQRALAAAEEGLFIFPIKPGTKGGTRKGDKGQKISDQLLTSWARESSCDPARIEKWWNSWPEANFGVDCAKSGLLVIDVDVKKGKEGEASLEALQEAHGKLPETRTAQTASGGRHLYFWGKSRNSVELLGSGLDIRSEGGYVVGVGSVVPEGAYAWETDVLDEIWEITEAPEWLVALCGEKRDSDKPRIEAPEAGWDNETDLRWVKHYLAKEARPSVEGEGGDENAFKVICRVRDRGISPEMAVQHLLEYWNPRCEPEWDADEIELKVDNAYQYARGDAGKDSPLTDFEDLEGLDEEDLEEEGFTGFFDEWVWVSGIKQFILRSDCTRRLDKEQFDSHFSHLAGGGKLSDKIFKAKRKLRKFFGICYRPGQEEFCGGLYNVWRKSNLDPIYDADVSVFLEHMVRMVPNETERNHVLDFLAYMVQKPGEKMSYALLVQGGPGIGKSVLGKCFGAIVGEHNTGRPSNNDLSENFTGWAAAKQLIIVEELMHTGRMETANKLKPMITDSVISIREMYRPPYTIENVSNFMMFTNYRDSIPLDDGDRRYLVIFSPMAVEEPDYYNTLWDWLGANDGSWSGAAKVAGWLLKRDLSTMTPKGHAPMTAAKEQMRRESLHEAHAFLLELYEANAVPFDRQIVCVDDLVAALPDRIARKTPRLGNRVAHFLRQEINARQLGQRRINRQGTRKILWSISGHEIVAGLSASEQGKLYAKQSATANDFFENIA